MNKLVCLFALICCLSLAVGAVPEFYPQVGAELPIYTPEYSYLKSIFSPSYRQSFLHGYGYPYSLGVTQQYGSQIPYQGQYPYLYPYTPEYQYALYGSNLPSIYYQNPYYQQIIGKPWYNLMPSLSTPYSYQSSYPSLSYPYSQGYPYNVQYPYQYQSPLSYPGVIPPIGV